MYSFALTTTSQLLKKFNIDPKSIGRLEVGTETLLDKSKSCKSVLMQLFESSGNTSIEGVDTVNACYGGTNALFNAVNWIESSAWDGRDAIVVAGDIALYKKGAARPTGGAGCVAMLIGPNAPIAFEPGHRGTYMKHVYDFYKADLTSEYPLVDGHFSNRCYTEAVDACYKAYHERKANLAKRANGHTNGINGVHAEEESEVSLDSFDYMAFHSPNCKLVAKSYARMLYSDYLNDSQNALFESVPTEIKSLDYEASLADKNLEKLFMGLTKKRFAERVQPSIEIPALCGNMYCGSVYGSLLSLICNVSNERLQGKRIGVFSYGSGLASSLFSLKVTGDISDIVSKVNLHARLEARKVVAPEIYDEVSTVHLKGKSVTDRLRCANSANTPISNQAILPRATSMILSPERTILSRLMTCSEGNTKSRHKPYTFSTFAHMLGLLLGLSLGLVAKSFIVYRWLYSLDGIEGRV